MAPLTRKRKAELDAAAEVALIQAQLESDAEAVRTAQAVQEPEVPQINEERPHKRQRTIYDDWFRPISPPPQVVVSRRSGLISFPKLTTPKPQHPTPIVSYFVPTTNWKNQISAKGRSSNDAETIMATKALFKHADKYGVVAMPTKNALEAWLEENKDEFIRAREKKPRHQPTEVRKSQSPPRANPASGVNTETPANHWPTGRVMRLQAPIRNDGILKRVCRCVRRKAAGILGGVVAALEDHVDREPAQPQLAQQPAHEQLVQQLVQERIAQQPQQSVGTQTRGSTSQKSAGTQTRELTPDPTQEPEDDILARIEAALAAGAEPLRLRPIAPPLDERFFHPNGQLQSVYRYLTAQIPLPRQWVQWAINNGVYHIPERGDIRDPGTYVADDNFSYDALHQMVHSGCFKTGRSEIDSYPEHWPEVKGVRDSCMRELTLHAFPLAAEPRVEGSTAPFVEPTPPLSISPAQATASRSPTLSPPMPDGEHLWPSIEMDDPDDSPIGASTPPPAFTSFHGLTFPGASILDLTLNRDDSPSPPGAAHPATPTTPIELVPDFDLGNAPPPGSGNDPYGIYDASPPRELRPQGARSTYALPDSFYDTSEESSDMASLFGDEDESGEVQEPEPEPEVPNEEEEEARRRSILTRQAAADFLVESRAALRASMQGRDYRLPSPTSSPSRH
ncbi:hypothetical protein GGR54DRAFT_634741 [Hypoxylon sp. NC1633]|nr:hypothetical protein GGR54DRAFT_634741 [Hypoxylon sp. NC1633]